MKKNKMMRIASVLLVMTLISTCAISGTFAKYVTKVSGKDSARVAKWGIVLELSAGEAFATEYELSEDHEDGDNPYEDLAVEAKVKVVAPGTSSAEVGDGEPITAKISGTPEVATHYEISMSGIKDILLPAGTYTDYTELKLGDDGKYAYGTFELAKDYTPVKWTLKADGTALATLNSLTDAMGKVDKIISKLETLVTDAVINVEVDEDEGTLKIMFDAKPGTAMNHEFTLEWAWDFDDNGAGTNDKADTYLGNVIADALLDTDVQEFEDEDAAICTDIACTVEVLAVQID